MRLKLIGCEVFTREVCHCVAMTPHIVDVEFTDKGAHDDSRSLRNLIQSKIDSCEDSGRSYEAILLCIGLCGNSTLDIEAKKLPIVMPRAHDCCTIFLGSKNLFKEHFGDNPSSPFSATGYIERGDGSYVHEPSEALKQMGYEKTYEDYVSEYGEENARYIWETLHSAPEDVNHDNTITFIDVPETSHLGYAERCKAQAEENGNDFRQLSGSIDIIKKLIFGDWNEEEFLVVEPGHRIAGVYDLDKVVASQKVEST